MAHQAGVDLTNCRAGLNPGNRTVGFNFDSAKVGARVDEEVVGRGLSRQTRSTRAKRHPTCRRARKPKQLRNFRDVTRNDNRVWCEQVVRRIHCKDDSVEGSGRHSISSAEGCRQGLQKRFLPEDKFCARRRASETHDRPCLPTSRQESRGRLPGRPG